MFFSPWTQRRSKRFNEEPLTPPPHSSSSSPYSQINTTNNNNNNNSNRNSSRSDITEFIEGNNNNLQQLRTDDYCPYYEMGEGNNRFSVNFSNNSNMNHNNNLNNLSNNSNLNISNSVSINIDSEYEVPFATALEDYKPKSRFHTFCSLTLGNRRFFMYLYTLIKFLFITFIQAYVDIFHIKVDDDFAKIKDTINLAIKITSFIYMAILSLNFTSRFIRETISFHRKVPLNTRANLMESLIFISYFVFTIFTTIILMFYMHFQYKYYYEGNEEDVALLVLFQIVKIILNLFMVFDMLVFYLYPLQNTSLFIHYNAKLPERVIHPTPEALEINP
ncbi:hypothetical protein ABK040_014967 [Willaertia magna]